MAVVSEGFGAYLRKKREERGLSLEELVERTKIPMRHLEAIESGRFHLLPGPAYVRGFLRLYASALELDPEAIVSLFQETDAARSLSNPEAVKAEGGTPRRGGARQEPLHPAWEVVALVLILAMVGAIATWAVFRTGM